MHHREVRSRRPNQIWNVGLTTVPTAGGFWVPWVEWALPQRWPFCWWVGVIVDHFSRRIMGSGVFTQNPISGAVRQMLSMAIRQAGASPDHLITDQGTQFTDEGFRRWCRRRDIRQRVELAVSHLAGRRHLPIVELKKKPRSLKLLVWVAVSHRVEVRPEGSCWACSNAVPT